MIQLTLSGNPQPWPRNRLHAKDPSQIYRPAWYTKQKTRWGWEAKAAMLEQGLDMLTGPVYVALTFYRSTRHRVDVDNLAKSALDALQGIVFADDSQVVYLSCIKVLGVGAPNARTEVTVMAAPEQATWRQQAGQFIKYIWRGLQQLIAPEGK